MSGYSGALSLWGRPLVFDCLDIVTSVIRSICDYVSPLTPQYNYTLYHPLGLIPAGGRIGAWGDSVATVTLLVAVNAT